MVAKETFNDQMGNDKAGVSQAVIRRFMTAASTGDLEAMERALKKYPDAVAWHDTHNNTALHYAAGAGHTDAAAFLLDHGADIEVRTVDSAAWDSVTPLIVAAQWEKNLDTVRLLAARGANLNAQTGQGETALMRAVQYSPYTVNQGQGEKILRTLIALGADETLKDSSGRTAFDIASKTAEPKAATVIREALAQRDATRLSHAQDEHVRAQAGIENAVKDEIAAPAAVLPPVKFKCKPPGQS